MSISKLWLLYELLVSPSLSFTNLSIYDSWVQVEVLNEKCDVVRSKIINNFKVTISSEFQSGFEQFQLSIRQAQYESPLRNFSSRLQVSEPTSYGTFVIETNGHSLQEFTAHLEKVSIINSQPVSSEAVGTWKANLNSPIIVKDAASLANFSAVTVYKIVTVLVRS